jgi:amino acid transporter
MNEKQKAYTFLAISGAILFVVGMIWATLVIMWSPVTYEKVKCYDRSYNEIIGQTCLEEHKIYDRILPLPIVIAFAGFTWIAISLHALSIESELEDKRINLNKCERRY